MTAKELRDKKRNIKNKIDELERHLDGLDFCIWEMPTKEGDPVETECKQKIYLSDKNKPFDVCPFCGGEIIYDKETKE